MNSLIIITLIVIFALTLFINPKETFEKKTYDCIISINVHEKFPFLLKQLKNISENVSCNCAVILNCNEYMLNECKANELPPNVFYYEEPLHKARSHGSLAEGIYRNMHYAAQNFTFDYFIVASSRTMFDNNLKVEDLKKLESSESPKKSNFTEEKYGTWCWPKFSSFSLFQHYKNNNLDMHSCAHEGTVFTKRACDKIIEFLESHGDIKTETFTSDGCSNAGSIEEWALQTIAVNEGETFYNIGTGCCSEERIGHLGPGNDAFKFSYKVQREMNMSRSQFMRCAI